MCVFTTKRLWCLCAPQCNIGNPQALGQKPISFTRQVMSIVLNPELLETDGLFNDDVTARARKYLNAMPSVGAYSDSSGVSVVRKEVADFIARRDGHPANAEDIFLTDGASSGVSRVMQIILRSKNDAILTPIPQYPLYSGLAALLKGSVAPYFLDEEQGCVHACNGAAQCMQQCAFAYGALPCSTSLYLALPCSTSLCLALPLPPLSAAYTSPVGLNS